MSPAVIGLLRALTAAQTAALDWNDVREKPDLEDIVLIADIEDAIRQAARFAAELRQER